MTICVSESLTSRRMLDAIENRHEAQENAEFATACNFTKAIEQGDPDAKQQWAGTTIDYAAAKALGTPYTSQHAPRRLQTAEEVLTDAMDFTDGPGMGDVLQLLALASKSTDAAVATAAKELVKKAAWKYASHYTPEVEA